MLLSKPAVKIDRGIRGLLTSEYAFKVNGESVSDGVKTTFGGKIQVNSENKTVTVAEGNGQYKKGRILYGFQNLGLLLNDKLTASFDVTSGNKLMEMYYYENTVITVVNGNVVMGVESGENQSKIDFVNGILYYYLKGDSEALMAAVSKNLSGSDSGTYEYWEKAGKDLRKNLMSKKWLAENFGYQGCEKGVYTFDMDAVKAITAVEETVKPYLVNSFGENGANQIGEKFAEAKQEYAGDRIKLVLTVKDGALSEISLASGADYDEASLKMTFEKTEENISYNTEKAKNYYLKYQEVKDKLNNTVDKITGGTGAGIEDILNGVGDLLSDIGAGVGDLLGDIGNEVGNALGGIFSGMR